MVMHKAAKWRICYGVPDDVMTAFFDCCTRISTWRYSEEMKCICRDYLSGGAYVRVYFSERKEYAGYVICSLISPDGMRDAFREPMKLCAERRSAKIGEDVMTPFGEYDYWDGTFGKFPTAEKKGGSIDSIGEKNTPPVRVVL